MYNNNIETISFTWDEAKNARNRIKHHITFEEACTAFYDVGARVLYDERHSYEEERWVLLGLSHEGKLLVVCHSLRNEGGTIRIISTRRATSREEAAYRRFNHAR